MKTYLIPIAALLFIPSWARADGYESYKDQPRATYSRAYTVQPVSWRCPPEFSRHECRRIRAEAELRRARRTRQVAVYVTPRQLRNVDPGPERIHGSRCIARVSVTGVSRPTEGMARGNAWKRWRETVRASAGEAFMDDRYAIKQDVRCHIASSGGWTKRCTVSAVPCR
jgi:hypothetical protein